MRTEADQHIAAPIIVPIRRPSRSRWNSLLGGAGALALHALAFSPLWWGSPVTVTRLPEEQGQGAASLASSSEPSMTLVLIQLQAPTAEPLFEELASRGSAVSDLVISIISPDVLPSFDLSSADAEAQTESSPADDAANRAVLFGRYTGQIDARILRGWLRPRSPVNDTSSASQMSVNSSSGADDTFRCQVRITQDASGNVLEQQLLNCNGTVAWQQSLVAAIQMASPLPAPPSPRVFTNVLTLSFEGHSYVASGPTEGYEFERPRALQQARADLLRPAQNVSSDGDDGQLPPTYSP